MRQVVIDGFLPFTQRFESYLLWFYLDVLGLVSIGYGNLVDPFSLCSGLQFVNPDGSPAPASLVQASWQKVKNLQSLKSEGGEEFEHLTSIRATPASIQQLCARKLALFENQLRPFFPNWDDFPADGQLLILSMMWAMGCPWAKWPHFCAAVNAGLWSDVAVPHGEPASCQMSETGENAGFHKRNLANMQLALNAAAAVAAGTGDVLT